MMAYSRLEDTFWQHPKLRRLADRLGIPRAHAMGLMASLWSWSQTMSPDGYFASDKFDAVDLAAGANWEGDPNVFVGAAIDVGLIDEDGDQGIQLHRWMDRAESHRRATEARRRREQDASTHETRRERVPDSYARVPDSRERVRECSSERRGEERRGEDNTSPSGPAISPNDVVEAWNRGCGSLPKARSLSDARKRKIRNRLSGHPERDATWWESQARRLAKSTFASESGWATFDWLIKNETNLSKVLEGNYDDKPSSNGRAKNLPPRPVPKDTTNPETAKLMQDLARKMAMEDA